MEPDELVVAEGGEHPDAAEPEDNFLAQSIRGVAAVEHVGEAPVAWPVVRQVRIEQLHGDLKPRDAGD